MTTVVNSAAASENITLNQSVVGSIPTALTALFKHRSAYKWSFAAGGREQAFVVTTSERFSNFERGAQRSAYLLADFFSATSVAESFRSRWGSVRNAPVCSSQGSPMAAPQVEQMTD